MARSTTGTTNDSKSATMSGIFNNHAALAGIWNRSPAYYVPAQLCHEREFLSYANRAYQQLTLPNRRHIPLLVIQQYSRIMGSSAASIIRDLLSTSQSVPHSNRRNRQTASLVCLPHTRTPLSMA